MPKSFTNYHNKGGGGDSTIEIETLVINFKFQISNKNVFLFYNTIKNTQIGQKTEGTSWNIVRKEITNKKNIDNKIKL